MRDEYKLNRPDVDWYQIRNALKARNKSGDTAPVNFVPFEQAYQTLTEKLQPQVFSLGFCGDPLHRPDGCMEPESRLCCVCRRFVCFKNVVFCVCGIGVRGVLWSFFWVPRHQRHHATQV